MWIKYMTGYRSFLPSEWKTHTLIWRNKANLKEHSLDDLFNSLRIYEAEVKHSSSLRNPTQNIAFVSSSNTDSTTDSVSAATSVSTVCAQFPIDVDDLEEIDLRWQMAMLTMRARRSPKDTRKTVAAEPQRRYVPEEPANFALMAIPSSSSASDNEVKSCSKACSKAYDELHSQYDKPTIDFQKSQFDVLSYQAALKSVEARLVLYKQNESILQENINMLKNEVQARDAVLVTLKPKQNQAEQERDDLKLKFNKFQTSSKSLTELSQPSGEYHDVPPPITGNFMPPKPDLVFHTAPIAVETTHSAFNIQLSPTKSAQDISHTTRPMALIIEDWVSDLEDESPVEASILDDTSDSTSSKTNGRSKRRNRKTCFVCRGVDHLIKDCNFHAKPKPQPTPRNYAHMGYDKQYASSTKKYPQKHIVPAAILTKSKPVSVTAARPISAVVSKIMATKPRHDRSLYTKNMSYFFDFQELNSGYVAFGGNPKGGKISDFMLPNENQVLLRVPRENNMYNVNLKDIVPSGDLTCLFAKTTIDEYNLWHRRLGHGIKREFSVPKTPQQNGIAERKNRPLLRLPELCWQIPYYLFHFRLRQLILLAMSRIGIGFMRPFGCPVTILNTLDSLGKFEGKVDEEFLVGYSVNSKAFRVFNSRTRIVQETLYVNFLENKPNVAGFQEEFDVGKIGEEANQKYMLFPVWSTGSTNPQNKEGDTTFDGKEYDAEKPEYTVNLSLSNSALSGEQDDMTKKKDKGKSPVDYFTGNRDFNADFEDYSKDSSNDVTATGPIVLAAGQNYSNNTNPISVASPSNTNTSPTHGKYLLQDASQSPDMLESEDIVYSDHESVGSDAAFNNLETSITVSPISTTRIHNVHPISQIISNLSLTTQTRSMARINRDQGGISQILNEDFHTCMFACFLSQEEPKRVHQALKDLSWIEAMQEELLQFKMQKV
nr:hypothetical protein [Tanacetum cinerariifolium]